MSSDLDIRPARVWEECSYLRLGRGIETSGKFAYDTEIISKFLKKILEIFLHQVLEINSSDKRCGRLVLDKVGEATRSQSLLKRYAFLARFGFERLTRIACRASGEDICQVSARNENANSGKRKKGLSKDDFESQMLVSKEPAVETGPTAALILFEEVDVLLDHDKG